MTLPYERTRAHKRLMDFSQKLLRMSKTEIRKNAGKIWEENASLRRHLEPSDNFDLYYKEKE